jgi:hypothetical protein
MAAAAILDNWFFKDPLELSFMQDILDKEMESSIHPGQVNQTDLYQYVNKPKLIIDRFNTDYKHSYVISCQGVKFHTDYTGICVLWVLRNDNYQVEDKKQVPEHQSPGSVFILDIDEMHRCKSIDGKTKNRYWTAISIDYELGLEKVTRQTAIDNLEKLIEILAVA